MLIEAMHYWGKHPLIVFSAGNGAMDAKWNGYPRLVSKYPDDIIVVSAVTQASPGFGRAGNSNFGSLVEIAAPGINVGALDGFGALLPHLHGNTSLAAPHVAGVAGLLLSFDPRLTNAELKKMLIDGARNGGLAINNGSANIYLLNAYESLKLAAQRMGAPLCGNRVWVENGNLLVERGMGVETILTNDPAVVEANPLHGGRRVVLTTYQRSWAIRWSNGGWVADTATSNLWLQPGGAGEANSLRGSSHSGDTAVYVWSNNLYRSVGRTDAVITTIPVSSYNSELTSYCGHEYVGPVSTPTDTAQLRVWNQWLAGKRYATEKCDYKTSYRSSSRVADSWAAYSPRYDSAMVVVNYRTDNEVIFGPKPCKDVVRLEVAVGDSFEVEVEFKCTDRVRTKQYDGREMWMVSTVTGSRRAVPPLNDPTYNLASVGLAEDGKEMVSRYVSGLWQFAELWEYNGMTRNWSLMAHPLDETRCDMAYELITTGTIFRKTPCGISTAVRTPATIAPTRRVGVATRRTSALPPTRSTAQVEYQRRRLGSAPGVLKHLMDWRRD